jgi:hypothetical protein
MHPQHVKFFALSKKKKKKKKNQPHYNDISIVWPIQHFSLRCIDSFGFDAPNLLIAYARSKNKSGKSVSFKENIFCQKWVAMNYELKDTIMHQLSIATAIQTLDLMV